MSLHTGFPMSEASLTNPDQFIGPRSGAKILYGAALPVDADVDETAAFHGAVGDAQLLDLKRMELPNTLPAGDGLSGFQLFADVAIVEEASIGLDFPDDPPEADYYSVIGVEGDIFQIEVLSETIRHQTGIDNVFDPQIAILDESGAGGHYYSTLGNDDGRLNTDSLIVDFVLPFDGKFVIEVFAASDTSTLPTDPAKVPASIDVRGEYELYVMRFVAVNQVPEKGTISLLAVACMGLIVARLVRGSVT